MGSVQTTVGTVDLRAVPTELVKWAEAASQSEEHPSHGLVKNILAAINGSPL